MTPQVRRTHVYGTVCTVQVTIRRCTVAWSGWPSLPSAHTTRGRNPAAFNPASASAQMSGSTSTVVTFRSPRRWHSGTAFLPVPVPISNTRSRDRRFILRKTVFCQ